MVYIDGFVATAPTADKQRYIESPQKAAELITALIRFFEKLTVSWLGAQAETRLKHRRGRDRRKPVARKVAKMAASLADPSS